MNKIKIGCEQYAWVMAGCIEPFDLTASLESNGLKLKKQRLSNWITDDLSKLSANILSGESKCDDIMLSKIWIQTSFNGSVNGKLALIPQGAISNVGVMIGKTTSDPTLIGPEFYC